MEKMCKGGTQRDRWAVSLCFAAAILSALAALHPGSRAWMGMNADQSFGFSTILATVVIFLATFILSRMVSISASEI